MSITDDQATWFQQTFEQLVANVELAIRGKGDIIRIALTCLLSEGHLLLEDNPGTGKTQLAKAIANTVPAVRPASTAAAAAPTTPMGTSIRVSVRPSADGSSNSTATAAHPTQSTTVPVIWTARLCGAKASPKPEPPITATTSQSTRAIQRTGDLAEACTSRQGIQRPLFTNR